MTIEEAARRVGLTPVAVRRMLERADARDMGKGVRIKCVSGITGRKIGRRWRVYLDSIWTDPTQKA
jgi:hypothetical protein